MITAWKPVDSTPNWRFFESHVLKAPSKKKGVSRSLTEDSEVQDQPGSDRAKRTKDGGDEPKAPTKTENAGEGTKTPAPEEHAPSRRGRTPGKVTNSRRVSAPSVSFGGQSLRQVFSTLSRGEPWFQITQAGKILKTVLAPADA